MTRFTLGLLLLSSLAAPAAGQRRAAGQEEFFIVSSIDLAAGRIVVKRPTEVTLVISVTPATTYRDERGRVIRLANLRAGDTAFIALTAAGGAATASSVRLGPMTVAELSRRYPELARPEPPPPAAARSPRPRRDASH